ncbi:MAG: LicD family protein, partial [Clostridiales bacterium]|nr:LicD family protein [Clostridiales bacterium]
MVEKGLLNATVPFEFSQVAEYEKKYDLYDLHEQLLNILTEFDRICRENDIHYSLADGTLLGAMRHADFIPWDDDADVMMTKEEYLKLKSVISRQQTVRMCKICFLDRITVRGMEEKGLYIDLFI